MPYIKPIFPYAFIIPVNHEDILTARLLLHDALAAEVEGVKGAEAFPGFNGLGVLMSSPDE